MKRKQPAGLKRYQAAQRAAKRGTSSAPARRRRRGPSLSAGPVRRRRRTRSVSDNPAKSVMPILYAFVGGIVGYMGAKKVALTSNAKTNAMIGIGAGGGAAMLAARSGYASAGLGIAAGAAVACLPTLVPQLADMTLADTTMADWVNGTVGDRTLADIYMDEGGNAMQLRNGEYGQGLYYINGGGFAPDYVQRSQFQVSR